jgi:hypothetical protein
VKAFVIDPKDPNADQVRANLHEFIDKLPRDKPWEWKWERFVKKRTNSQNHALFGVAYPALTDATGFTKDELHEAFCKRFFGTVEREFMGERVTRPFRTTTTDEHGKPDVIGTEPFARFYDMVQQVGAEAGVYVPDPDPMHGLSKRFER